MDGESAAAMVRVGSAAMAIDEREEIPLAIRIIVSDLCLTGVAQDAQRREYNLGIVLAIFIDVRPDGPGVVGAMPDPRASGQEIVNDITSVRRPVLS